MRGATNGEAKRTAEDERADVVAWLEDIAEASSLVVVLRAIVHEIERGEHVGAAEIWSQSEIDACHQEGAERGAKLRSMTDKERGATNGGS